ncbi:protein MNN4 [Mercurialis annua]|uniref:protein MNN4 n=1 Tax=Mercurialis annua TaxID=3986 RepID=UPI00215E588E|nr:protein MNN4 [Mercurialis annua]
MACTIDFRRLDEGFGGKTYKRKRESQSQSITASQNEQNDAASMEIDAFPPSAKRSAVSSSENPDKPVYGKPTYDGVIAGKESGRKWKQVRTQRASAKHVSIKGTSLEERVMQKEIKKAYRERMNELKDEIKKNKQEKRKKREEREKKKKENILRSGTKLQIISNPKTLKKIAKSKDRKLLKVVSDDLVNRNKKKIDIQN